MTNTLLIILILLTLLRIIHAYFQNARLINWLDAYSEMTGDLLRELINTQNQEENPYILHGKDLDDAVESVKRK